MKDKLQFKITWMMTALVTAVLIAAGLMLMGHTALSHYRTFDARIRRSFDQTHTAALQTAFAADPSAAPLQESIAQTRALWDQSAHLHFCILRGDTVIYTDGDGGSLPLRRNLQAVQKGEKSGANHLFGGLPSYALALEGEYTFYIWDDGTALAAQLREIGVLFLPVLAIAWVLAAVLSMILARTITKPILRLTDRAEQLSLGVSLGPSDIKRNDEIGTLDRTFDEMAAKLQQTIARLTLMIDQMPMPVCAMSEGEILHQNKLFADLPDLPFSIACGKGRAWIGKTEYDWFISEFYDNAFLIVLQDVTPFTDLDRARRSFVADVSHELKTPLTVLRTYSETLADPAPIDPTMQKNFLQTMLSECDRMDHIVGQLLTLSRLESAPQTVTQSVDLVPLVRAQCDALALAMQQKGQSLHLSLCDSALSAVTADEAERILSNLLSNALRYGGEGGDITLSLETDGKQTVLTVEDNGIGIAEEHIPRIFDKFYRVDTARARATGGTGLGLSIVQEIVTLRGGEIKVQSEIHKYTRFTVTLPC